jgi:hypothetical protein
LQDEVGRTYSIHTAMRYVYRLLTGKGRNYFRDLGMDRLTGK